MPFNLFESLIDAFLTSKRTYIRFIIFDYYLVLYRICEKFPEINAACVIKGKLFIMLVQSKKKIVLITFS